MIGNIFLVYAELLEQGENTITVVARDKAGNAGVESVTVYLDDTAPATPSVDEIPALTDKRILPLTGTGEAGVGILVEGGLVPVLDFVAQDGTFTVNVPLKPNALNVLSVTAIDTAGNQNTIMIAPHPLSGHVYFANCDDDSGRPQYEAVVFNNFYVNYTDGVDPECNTTATAERTWGAIKSIYSE